MLHCIHLAPQLYLQKGLLRIKSFIHSFIDQAKAKHIPKKSKKINKRKHKKES